jgi:hypothetical protein
VIDREMLPYAHQRPLSSKPLGGLGRKANNLTRSLAAAWDIAYAYACGAVMCLGPGCDVLIWFRGTHITPPLG